MDSPMLAVLELTTQLRWHDVCHGGRMLAPLLAAHPDALRPPPGSDKEPLQLLLPEDAVPAAAPASPSVQDAPALPASLPVPLAALLYSSGLLQPAQQLVQQQPADSSSGSDDTCAVRAAAPSGPVAARVPSSSTLSASTEVSGPPAGHVKGVRLALPGAHPLLRR